MELVPTLWIQKYKIKNEAGIPIEFDSHYFLYDIYNDMSQFQVVLKPPQIGMTVLQIIKTLWCAMKQSWDIIYTLPTQGDVHDMAGGKINRIIAQNPVLVGWVKDHDTVEQKAVGKNIIYYRGTFSTKAAMMVTSDLNVHDEVDASDASVITQYETRLEAKSDGRRWYFSHPSIAGFGVDIHWQMSDQKEFHITCPTCLSEQVMGIGVNNDWKNNIDFINKTYVCRHCRGVLPDTAREKGEWRNKDGVPWNGTIDPKYKFSGWHVSQMMCSWISAESIIDKANDPNKDQQYFWNYVLGLPFVGSENKIDPEVVLRNVTGSVNSQEDRIVIGVDTGLPIHYTLMNKEGIFFNGKCRPPDERYDPYDTLEGLLNRFPNSILVADQGGDLVGIRKLQAKYNGRVFLCYYRKDRKSKEMIKWGEHQDFGIVVVDRNRMIQMIVEQFRDTGRLRLNGSQDDWKEFASHFGYIYRVAKETPFGIEYSWERNGPDHYVHALLYGLVGLDKFAQASATIIGDSTNLDHLPIGRIFDNSQNVW